MPALKTWLSVLISAVAVFAQGVPDDQTDVRNLTPDWFWHNRYFALLGMGSYGDFNETCPTQTFTRQEQLKNFPNSTLPPWTLLETWSTPSGCKGFSAIVPEMNKVLLVFQGNWSLEVELDPATTPWESFLNSTTSCDGCTANAFAVQGYNEAKAATNMFEITRNAYYGAGLVFAITGHGLGGMHALLASVDFNNERICYYSHNHGTPRTFNQAGVNWYNSNFNGEAGERATWNNDQMGELFPASEDYQHAGTPFYYWGWDESAGQPNTYICWTDADDPACAPRDQGLSATIQEQHYHYFADVAQCGSSGELNTTYIGNYLDEQGWTNATWRISGYQQQPYTMTNYIPATVTSDSSPNWGGAATTTSDDDWEPTTTPYRPTTTSTRYTWSPPAPPTTWSPPAPPTTETQWPTTSTRRPRSSTTRTSVPTRYTTRVVTTTVDDNGDDGGSSDGSF